MKRSSQLRRTPKPRTVKPLARKTRLSPASKSKRNWRREAAAERAEYMATHLRCMVCGISVFAHPSRPLECHHLMGRGAQKHECVENYGAICDRDHRHFHSGGELGDDGERLPELTPGMILFAKSLADGPIDEALLAGLRGWKGLPEDWLPVELPAEYMRERANNWS
jgi:hypothetical protein